MLDMLCRMLHPVPHLRMSLERLDIFIRRFLCADAKSQLGECTAKIRISDPAYVNEKIFPIVCPPHPESEPSPDSKAVWLWGSMNGIEPYIVFYAMNNVHLINKYVSPASLFRVYGTVLDLGEMPHSERADIDDGLWTIVQKTAIHTPMLVKMRDFASKPPFVQCLIAAKLSSGYHTMSDLETLSDQGTEALFDTVKTQYGLEDFFKKYKNYYSNQLSVLKSWLRLEKSVTP